MQNAIIVVKEEWENKTSTSECICAQTGYCVATLRMNNMFSLPIMQYIYFFIFYKEV